MENNRKGNDVLIVIKMDVITFKRYSKGIQKVFKSYMKTQKITSINDNTKSNKIY